MQKLAELAGVTSIGNKKPAEPAKKAEPEAPKEEKAPVKAKTKIVFDDDEDIVFGKPKEKPKPAPVKKPADPLLDFFEYVFPLPSFIASTPNVELLVL